MIQKILNIAKLAQTTQNNQIKSFNTTLPLLLEILQKSKMGYKLKLGNATIEAKSGAELQIGAKYWAIVKEKDGELIISGLKKRPQIAESAKNSPLKFDISDLPNLFKNAKGANFVGEFYENLVDKITNTHYKDEFNFLTNSLVALQNGILNLVIREQKRDFLLQIKKQKNDKIEFSAVFNNLGIINGSLYKNDILHLVVQYENVKKLLENNIDSLNFKEIHISLNEHCEILFDAQCENSFSA